MLRAADAVVAISAEDAAALQKLAGAGPGPGLGEDKGRAPGAAALDPVVVPQVVTFTRREEESLPQGGAGPRLCYVGNLTWHPNVQGLDWFLTEVWPLLRRRLPGVALTIAGSGLATGGDGRPLFPSRWQVPGAEVVGFVPDLLPLYRRSLVMIVPILSGSGIRIKLLEALRAGMPVVSTPQGAAGLPLRDGGEALIEGDPEGFAAAVVRLCGDDGLRRRLREAGYRYLSAHHSESAAQGAMRRALGLLPNGTTDEPHT
jgi:glycosyltransferase involved in cell wall biosynthesis